MFVVYVYVYAFVCMFVACIHVYACVCMFVVCVYMYVHVCVHVYACTCGSWSTASGAVLRNGYCIGYSPVAVMKYSDESNLREKGLILA